MKGLIYSESAQRAKELMSFLKDQMELDLALPEAEAVQASSNGASRVYAIYGDVYEPFAVASAVVSVFDGHDYLFVPATNFGRQVAPIAAQLIKAEMESEIFYFRPEQDGAIVRRYFYGGKTLLEEKTGAKVFTVMTGLAQPAQQGSPSEVIRVEAKGGLSRVLQISGKQKASADITKADIIVSVGRGLGKKEGLELVRQLASVLGAEVAGSRPVCSDLHWLDEDRQVGLTGKRVRPRVYVALGISGQIQHIVGMRDSKVVIAVNKDKTAPIFQECDYGIVGDIYEVVPKLIEKLK